LGWAQTNYPKLLILFVPAGYTGKLNPVDLNLCDLTPGFLTEDYLVKMLLTLGVASAVVSYWLLAVRH